MEPNVQKVTSYSRQHWISAYCCLGGFALGHHLPIVSIHTMNTWRLLLCQPWLVIYPRQVQEMHHKPITYLLLHLDWSNFVDFTSSICTPSTVDPDCCQSNSNLHLRKIFSHPGWLCICWSQLSGQLWLGMLLNSLFLVARAHCHCHCHCHAWSELSIMGAALVKLGVAEQRGSHPSSKARCCHCFSIYPTLLTCLTSGQCFFSTTNLSPAVAVALSCRVA